MKQSLMNMLITVLLLWNMNLIDATIITSISKMEMLALSEKEMFAVYQTFIRETAANDGLDELRRYKDGLTLTDIYAVSGTYMENPINAFHFIKRMHDVWGKILSYLESENGTQHPPTPVLDLQRRLQAINHRYGSNTHVTSDDLHYAALAIVRLWQTYKLDLSALIGGEILDEVTSPMTNNEVFYICNQLNDDKYYYNAIVWLRALQNRMKQSPNDNTEAEFTRVARTLASTYAKTGMPWKSVEILEHELIGKKEDVNVKKLKRDINYFTQKTADIPVSDRNTTLTRDERDLKKSHYEALCRGAIRRSNTVKSHLRCIHRPTKVPYYRVKEEIISLRPRLSMFYEVITEDEISHIKEMAKTKLQESLVGGSRSRSATNFRYRISQTAWFRNIEGDIFETLSKRIELITGLSTKQIPLPYDGEDLQVLNYGVGGMYEPHEDYFGVPIHIAPSPPDQIYELDGAGDREATWMFYLSDVKAGGATVFTDINVTVPPVKGAAVFWYDIKRTGNLDDLTTHAGCPVLLGSKWGLILWTTYLSNATIITSILKMEMLASAEKELFSVYQTFIRETDEIDGLDELRRYNDEMTFKDIFAVSGTYMENPINAFHFIKRILDVWGKLISQLESEIGSSENPPVAVQELQRRLQAIDLQYGSDIRVTSDDLHNAALAIVRLWQTYELDISALLRGEILDEVTNPLTNDEVFYICNQLNDEKYYYNAIVWLRALQNRMKQSPDDTTEADLTRVARILASTYAKAGMPWKSVDILEYAIVGKNEDANVKKLKRDTNYFNQKTAEIPLSERNTTLTRDERDLKKSHYEALCRGAIRRSNTVKSHLRCIHRPTKVPYYRVKEEIISFRPRLSMFYEVITEDEISLIKEMATTRLGESTIGDASSQRTKLDYRISQTAWFPDWEEAIIETISKRVGLITGLSTTQRSQPDDSSLPYDSEDLQVLNYGIGGMYEAHEDYFGYPIHLYPDHPDSDGSGDREATWMFYLSDVKAGGATVLTKINVTVSPVKGAAVFWYNIKRNGDVDDQTQHAGCPVLLGSKWVANKWIHQRGNMFRRPCGRYPFSIDIPIYS